MAGMEVNKHPTQGRIKNKLQPHLRETCAVFGLLNYYLKKKNEKIIDFSNIVARIWFCECAKYV